MIEIENELVTRNNYTTFIAKVKFLNSARVVYKTNCNKFFIESMSGLVEIGKDDILNI